jgi:hypothetical protein
MFLDEEATEEVASEATETTEETPVTETEDEAVVEAAE